MYISVLNNPLSPKLADKHVFENEINIDGGKHILKQLLNSAFVSSE